MNQGLVHLQSLLKKRVLGFRVSSLRFSDPPNCQMQQKRAPALCQHYTLRMQIVQIRYCLNP